MSDGIMQKLPKDVVIYVFLKLPLKSLLRFKSIFQSFNSLIRSSTFINLHFNYAPAADTEIILFKRSFREESNLFRSTISFFFSDYDNDDLRHVSPDLEVPYLTNTNSCIFHKFLGPCHGLIVLTDKVTTVLFNPATRNCKLLQPSPFGNPMGFHRSIDGVAFGFDSISNEYKIVRLAEVCGEPPFYCYTVRDWRVEIYELSTDSWRELDHISQEFPHVHWRPCAEIFYKGSSHWFGNADTVVILCFDMCTETFRSIKMPNSCHVKDRKCYGLLVLNECLTLICYPYPGCVIDPTIDFMEIWVMKEYCVNTSWIEKYIIPPLSIESPLAIWKDRLLLLQTMDGLLISYDLNSNEVKKFNLHGWPKSLKAVVYEESLAWIPKGNEHSPQVEKY